jgi:hypothetical protein
MEIDESKYTFYDRLTEEHGKDKMISLLLLDSINLGMAVLDDSEDYESVESLVSGIVYNLYYIRRNLLGVGQLGKDNAD